MSEGLEVFGVTYCISHPCIFEGSQGSSGELGDEGNWSCHQFWRQHRERLHHSLKRRAKRKRRSDSVFCSEACEGKEVPLRRKERRGEKEGEWTNRKWKAADRRNKGMRTKGDSLSEKNKHITESVVTFSDPLALSHSSQILKINPEEDENLPSSPARLHQ